MISICKLDDEIDAEFYGAEYSPNGNWIAWICGRQRKLSVMASGLFEQLADDTSSEQEIYVDDHALSCVRLSFHPCSCVKWSPNSTQIACNQHIDIVIYRVEQNKNTDVVSLAVDLILKQEYWYGACQISWSVDGAWLASAGASSGRICVWGITSTARKAIGKKGHCLPKFTENRLQNCPLLLCVAWSPTALKLVESYGRELCIWEFCPKSAQFNTIVRQDSPNKECIRSIAWSIKNQIAVGCSKCSYILDDRGVITHVLSIDARISNCLAWSADGEYLACGNRENVQVWHHLQHVHTFPNPGATSVSFSSKMQLLSTHAKSARISSIL